jgi:hypothetical protein
MNGFVLGAAGRTLTSSGSAGLEHEFAVVTREGRRGMHSSSDSAPG